MREDDLKDQKSNSRDRIKNAASAVIDKVLDLFENGFIEELPKVVDPVVSDRDHKRRIYSNVARVIQKQADIDYSSILSAVYFLCAEDDEELLKANPISPDIARLAERLRRMLLAIKVNYDEISRGGAALGYLCETEVYFLIGNKPRLVRIEEKITRDELPGLVREHMLTTGDTNVTVKLFPQGA